MYLNDQLGCCVISWILHAIGLFTANASDLPGSTAIYSDADVVRLYSAIGGYNPNAPLVWDGQEMVNPTDNGCNEQDALAYWLQHGDPAGNHKILGYLAVDPTNVNEIQTALWLFENLMYGIELPDRWRQVQGPGFVWDVDAPNPRNGHCVGGVGYDSQGVKISTWGMTGTITYRAMAYCMQPAFGGALYVVLSEDAVNKATAKAPNGLDLSQLIADFDAIGGRVPLPTPVTPPPKPTPVNPPAPQPQWSDAVNKFFVIVQTVYAFFQTPQGKTVLTLGEDYAKQIWDWLISQQPSSVEHCAMLLQSPRCPCPPQLLATCESPRRRFRAVAPPDVSKLPANIQQELAELLAAKEAHDAAQSAAAQVPAAKEALQTALNKLGADMSAYFLPSA
jgi:hypothetical protein